MSSLLAILVMMAALFGIFLASRVLFWYSEGKKLQISGYMPPKSSKVARFTFKSVCRLITRLFVGPVTVIGKENAKFKGRGLVLPNHIFIWDFAVFGAAIDFSYRQIGKAAEFKNRIIATFVAWIGTVGVQVEGGKSQDNMGNAVVDAGAAILKASKGSRLLMCPQGKLNYLKPLEPTGFRTGATRILQQTANGLPAAEPLYALPVAVHYITDRSKATLFQRIFYPLGLGLLRTTRWKEPVTDADGNTTLVRKKATLYGVIVVIGKPISRWDLPVNPREGIELIRQRIESDLKVAEQAR